MLDVMLDLETLGTTPGSAIVAIGAVEFDMQNLVLGARFYATISLKSCVQAGLTIDPDTVTWWLKQTDAARRAITGGTPFALVDALNEFTAFLAKCAPSDNVRVWGNGPSFDNALLSAAYRAVGLEQPWRYWNDRCLRTLSAMFPSIEKPPREGTHHHALDDAEYQVERVLHIRRTLRAKRA
jgi:hypothetical protein